LSGWLRQLPGPWGSQSPSKVHVGPMRSGVCGAAHDGVRHAPESAFAVLWNGCSRWSGIRSLARSAPAVAWAQHRDEDPAVRSDQRRDGAQGSGASDSRIADPSRDRSLCAHPPETCTKPAKCCKHRGGEVLERLKRTVSKTVVPARVPWVRIPPSPPVLRSPVASPTLRGGRPPPARSRPCSPVCRGTFPGRPGPGSLVSSLGDTFSPSSALRPSLNPLTDA
jgi:hypothetical protein